MDTFLSYLPGILVALPALLIAIQGFVKQQHEAKVQDQEREDKRARDQIELQQLASRFNIEGAKSVPEVYEKTMEFTLKQQVRLQDMVTTLQTEDGKKAQALTALGEQLLTVQRQYTETLDRLENMSAEMTALRESNEQLQEQNTALIEEKTQLIREKTELLRTLEQIQNRYDVVIEGIDIIMKQLDGLGGSPEWKLPDDFPRPKK